MLVCRVLSFHSGTECHIIETTHIVYAVFVLHQHKEMVFVRWDGDDLLSMVYNEIIFSDKQLRASGRLQRDLHPMSVTRVWCWQWGGHTNREFGSCALCISPPPSTGIAFWIDARRNEKWRACFYVNWLLSARPRPVIRELTIRRNQPRTQRNSIKASHLSLISHCMGEIRNSQMCGDTNVFWFVHQLLPTIRKELFFLSKHHPGLGRPTRGGDVCSPSS